MNISAHLTRTSKLLKKHLATASDFAHDPRAESTTLSGVEDTPPANLSDKDIVIGGAAAGALAGGAASLYHAATAESAPVEILTANHPITESLPLEGPGLQIDDVVPYGMDELEGFDVEFSALAPEREVVGELTQEYALHQDELDVIGNGALAIVGGATLGAGLGFAAVGLRKLMDKGMESEKRDSSGPDAKTVLAAGAVGTALGAATGVAIHQNHTHTLFLDSQSINYEPKVVGQIPSGFAIEEGNPLPQSEQEIADMMHLDQGELAAKGVVSPEAFGPQDVLGHQPVRNAAGELDIQTEQLTETLGPDFVETVAGAAAIGAVTGVFGAVLSNVVKKSL